MLNNIVKIHVLQMKRNDMKLLHFLALIRLTGASLATPAPTPTPTKRTTTKNQQKETRKKEKRKSKATAVAQTKRKTASAEPKAHPAMGPSTITLDQISTKAKQSKAR